MVGRAWLVVLAACGRVGFEGVPGDGRVVDAAVPEDAGLDGAIDAALVDGPTFLLGYVKAPDPNPGDEFGWAVAFNETGDILAVGAPFAKATGIVYVYRREATAWVLEAELAGTDSLSGDEFGGAVALSGDGTRLLVGADEHAGGGSAYLFARTNGTWAEAAIIRPANREPGDLCGRSVAIDRGGMLAVIGAIGESSSAIGVNGDETNNLAPQSGAAYVFSLGPGRIQQEAYLKAANTDTGDGFGNSVAIGGNFIVVGADGEDGSAPGVNGPSTEGANGAGAAYVYQFVGDWTFTAYLKGPMPEPGDFFGLRLAIDPVGATVIVGAPADDDAMVNAGAADVFTLGATPVAIGHLLPSGPTAGAGYGAVAIAPDATAVVIGGPGYANSTGRTTELTRDGSNFTSGRMTSAGQPDEGDQYGCSVAHGPGTRIAVGACREASSGTPGDNSTPGAGAVFIID